MRAEGDAQRYIDHAVNLRNSLRFLRRNEKTAVEGTDGGVGTCIPLFLFPFLALIVLCFVSVRVCVCLMSDGGGTARADLVRVDSLNALEQSVRLRVRFRSIFLILYGTIWVNSLVGDPFGCGRFWRRTMR